jgi:hypothetical protein
MAATAGPVQDFLSPTEVNPYDHMTDEQIMERLQVIQEQTDPILAQHGIVMAGLAVSFP